MFLCQTISDLSEESATLKNHRYGVIETKAGLFEAVHLKPWPKLVSWRELWPVGDNHHARGNQDRCLLYYNQPRRHSNFLTLKYVVSTSGTSYKTFLASLKALDFIAFTKRSDALLCDVANTRISDRLLQRMGWEAHKPQRWHRNFIKRFYGTYPAHCSS